MKCFWLSHLCDFPGFLPPMSGDPWIAALLLVDSWWMLLEHWYRPHHTGGFKDVWDHGSPFPSILLAIPILPVEGNTQSWISYQICTPKVKALLWLVGCCQTEPFCRPWYHNHLESVSILELYILPLVNRDKHPFLFSLHTLQKGGCPGMKFVNFFFHKNLPR